MTQMCRYQQNTLISKISLDYNFVFTRAMHDYVCHITPQITVLYKIIRSNDCSNFITNSFHPFSFKVVVHI